MAKEGTTQSNTENQSVVLTAKKKERRQYSLQIIEGSRHNPAVRPSVRSGCCADHDRRGQPADRAGGGRGISQLGFLRRRV